MRPSPAFFAALLALLLCLAAAGGARAQVELDQTQDLGFDRPESWAMKYFGSVSFLTSFGGPRELEPGEVVVGLEGSWLPHLSDEERRVGFSGDKEEDLNRSSVFGRGRVAVGLPGAFVLTAGYVPPLEVDGIEPHLLSVGLGRPLLSRGRFRLGATLSGEVGTFEGDITCPDAAVAAGDDPEENPFGCIEPSSDELDVRHGGLELTGRWELGRTAPYLSVLAAYYDAEFQVDARYRTIVDRTLLRTDGWTWGATAGLSYRATERLGITGEAFYSPLEVARGASAATETDALFHARVLVTYRVRAPGPSR